MTFSLLVNQASVSSALSGVPQRRLGLTHALTPAVVYQLYVNRDRAASEKILRKIELAGVDAIMLTVDAPVMGKRERDMRAKGEEVKVGGDTGTSGAGAGVAAAISGYIDPNLVS